MMDTSTLQCIGNSRLHKLVFNTMSIYDKKDNPYNNASSSNGGTLIRKKAKAIDRQDLHCEILYRPQPKKEYKYWDMVGPRVELIPLKTTATNIELKYPLKNTKCPEKNSCRYEMSQLLDYLEDNIYEESDGTVVYYCINCFKDYHPNVRPVADIFLDKELCLYIGKAKAHYLKEPQQSRLPFNRGFIRISPNGIVEYEQKLKIPASSVISTQSESPSISNAGFKNKSVLIKDPRERPEDRHIKFSYQDREDQIESYSMFIQIFGQSLSRILSVQANFKIAIGALEESKKSQFFTDICTKLREKMGPCSSIKDIGKERFLKFTFGFYSQTYFNPFAPDITFLVVYYPHLKLWRRYHLLTEKGKFELTDSGAYIKHPTKPCIYSIGGVKIKYALQKENTRSVMNRTFEYKKGCYAIDLTNVDPLKPTKIVKVTKSKIAIKNSNGMSSSIYIKGSESPVKQGQPPTPKSTITSSVNFGGIVKQVPIVGQNYPDDVVATSLSDFPQPISDFAGVYHEEYVYTFGGCKLVTKDYSYDEAVGVAYRLKVSQKGAKWQKLKPMPRLRYMHNVVVYNNLFYIFGGFGCEPGAYLGVCKFVEIYDPAKDTYQSKEFSSVSYYQLTNTNKQQYAEKATVCQISKSQFLVLNGGVSHSYIFNAQNMEISAGGPQINLSVACPKVFRQVESQYGARYQQVVDLQPPCHNGLFYYMHHSLTDQQIRVIYGDKNQWYITRESDPAEYTDYK